MLWPHLKLSRPIYYSALEAQKFGLFSNGHCMACGRLYTCEDVQITMITVVLVWVKSGLRGNLTAKHPLGAKKTRWDKMSIQNRGLGLHEPGHVHAVYK